MRKNYSVTGSVMVERLPPERKVVMPPERKVVMPPERKVVSSSRSRVIPNT